MNTNKPPPEEDRRISMKNLGKQLPLEIDSLMKYHTKYPHLQNSSSKFHNLFNTGALTFIYLKSLNSSTYRVLLNLSTTVTYLQSLKLNECTFVK